MTPLHARLCFQRSAAEPVHRFSRTGCRAVFRLAWVVAVVLLGGTMDAQIERLTDGIVVPVNGGWTKLTVEGEQIVRVTVANERTFFARSSLMVAPRERSTPGWELSSDSTSATVATARLHARLDLRTGAVSFLDVEGRLILAERAGGRSQTPAEVQGEQTFHVRQQWEPVAGESLYGLGQQQLGILDVKGYDLDLWQHNTHVVVPFLVSSRGYGILWDNFSYTRFGDLRPFVAIPPECLRDVDGRPGGLTTGSYASDAPETLIAPARSADLMLAPLEPENGEVKSRPLMRWIGELVPTVTGDHQLQTYSNGSIKVWLDGRLVIDHWRHNWLADHDQVKVRLEAGKRYSLRVDSGGEQSTTVQLRWKTPPPPDVATSLWSEVGDGIDYYFVYGPALDRVVAGYRFLTGRASLMPRWALGLWQSRQRYETAQQSLDVIAGYRQRGLPLDNIVQDWQYWPRDKWGSHAFDPQRFPDPDGWIKAIHGMHARLMISVWGKFYPGTDNFEAMHRAGFLYEPNLIAGERDWLKFPFTFYDAFNRDAGRLFWEQIEQSLFRRGVDAWWMDATEPDLVESPPTLERIRGRMHPTALGSASRVLNASPLMNSRNVYEGQRSAAPDQRVFILTRSGFAGIQRYASAVWSGDITSTWTALAKQIPAGLGLSLSGIPWWTTDSGGYTPPGRYVWGAKPDALEEWRELNARWFQFATFCPLTRLHGELVPREPWTFGGDEHPAYKSIEKFDHLRYRLLPYLYSIAAAATHEDGTMMRPLAMDFPDDPGARALVDEYMFGPAFLVAPVTTYRARSRAVYLPASRGGWFDFWSGAVVEGGKRFDVAAPYDALPLFVRAGAIVPFGPALQYTDEKPADPIRLIVYGGADGVFTLYEDDGVSYAYERGEAARIPLRWDDTKRALTLERRQGAFPGMLAERTFEIVVLTAGKPAAFSLSRQPDQTVRYTGETVTVVFP